MVPGVEALRRQPLLGGRDVSWGAGRGTFEGAAGKARRPRLFSVSAVVRAVVVTAAVPAAIATVAATVIARRIIGAMSGEDNRRGVRRGSGGLRTRGRRVGEAGSRGEDETGKGQGAGDGLHGRSFQQGLRLGGRHFGSNASMTAQS